MSKNLANISDTEWADCLARLRDARALMLSDAEAFHEAAMTLERVGQVLCGKMRNGLGAYRDELIALATREQTSNSSAVVRLFETVREARNMAVHEGAWARHLGGRLVDLFLILEQAIMDNMKCAGDIMVRQSVVAELWQLIAHVRQAMLANSFSSLPVFVDNQWQIVTDLMVMRFLRDAGSKEDRNKRSSKTLGAAIQDGDIVPMQAKCYAPATKIEDIAAAMDQGVVLITEGDSSAPRLVGILSAFDLL